MEEPTVDPHDEAAGPMEPDFGPGKLIDHRYLVKYHVRGGVNDVYLCEEFPSGREVALKFPQSNQSTAAQARIFLDEVNNWARLREHPHVVDCLSVGVHQGRRYLVLEWVGAPELGRDVQAYLTSLGFTEPKARQREAVRLVREACDGVAYIHEQGVVHGDLKPGNILVDTDGRAKITDLGMAPTGPLFKGTPPYAAPEVQVGSDLSVRADIYALGYVLYELAVGRRPFESSDDLPSELRRLIKSCLTTRTWRRPSSARKLRERLDRIFAEELAGEDKSPASINVAADPAATRREYLDAIGRAFVPMAAGRRQEAVRDLTHVIPKIMKGWDTHAWKAVTDQADSALPWTLHNRGILRGSVDELQSSMEDFSSVIRLKPRLAVAHANLGVIFQKLSMPTLALTAYNRAVEIDSKDHRILLKRARLLADRGWLSAARADCEKALSQSPDDAAACASMADVLFALGCEEDASHYRARSLEAEGSRQIEEFLEVNGSSIEDSWTNGLYESFKGNHVAAIESFSAGLEVSPWEFDALYFRGTSHLDAGSFDKALKDFDKFLESVSTTHPFRAKAKDSRRRALEGMGTPEVAEPDELEGPLVKSSHYIAGRLGCPLRAEALVNWLPIPAKRQLLLLDMLYSDDASRKHHAERLIWLAFYEDLKRREALYQDLLHDLPDEYARQIAVEFAGSDFHGDLALKNGLGVPVLLTEVELSRYPVKNLAFTLFPPLSLSWSSAGSMGLWQVVPGFESTRGILQGLTAAPTFSADSSRHLLVAEAELAVYSSMEDDVVRRWFSPSAEEAIATACFYRADSVAVGLSSGTVVLLDEALQAYGSVQLAQDEEALVRPGEHGSVSVFCGGSFYCVTAAAYGAVARVRLDGMSVPLAFDGERAVCRSGEDSLFLVHLEQPRSDTARESDAALCAEYSTDGGFAAAAISLDGTVIAAVCGAYLHVWRSVGSGTFAYLPITPQPWSSSVAVSPDGAFVAVGSEMGSVSIYRFDELRER